MEVVCTGKKKLSFYFLVAPHDICIALSLLTPLEKNPTVAIGIICYPNCFILK